MTETRSPQPLHRQLFALTLMQLTSFRWAWRNMLILGVILPLVSLLGFGGMVRSGGQETVAHFLAGSVVMVLLFDHQTKLTSNFAFMRAAGTLTFFYTLPVYRHLLIVATNIAFFVLLLPTLLTTTLFGSWLLKVNLQVSVLVLLAIPLCSLTMAGLGAIIGLSFQRVEEAMAVNRLVILLMMVAGPVLVPAAKLPQGMVWAGYLSPATYAASAIRQTLVGPVTGRIALDLGALAVIACANLLLVGIKTRPR